MGTAGKRCWSRSAASDGFTVAEFIIAMSILFIVLMGVLGAVEFAAASTRQGQMRDNALKLATEKMETARNMPFDVLGTYNSDGTQGPVPGKIPASQTVGPYVVTTSVEWVKQMTKDGYVAGTYKKIKITVVWTSPAPGSLSLESAAYSKSQKQCRLNINATDVDSLDAVPNVRITVNPSSGSNADGTTDDSGDAYWPQLQVGTFVIDSVSKVDSNGTWLADISKFGTKTLSMGVLNTYGLEMQRPATAHVKVIGLDGQTIDGVTVSLTNTERTGLTFPTRLTANGGVTAAWTQLWRTTSSGYTAVCTKSGYLTATATGLQIAHGGGSEVEWVVTMQKTAPMKITATKYGTATTISGASVTVTGAGTASGHNFSGTTSSTGTVSFDIDTAGDYTVVVSKSGYQTYTTTVTITTANLADVNYTCNIAAALLQYIRLNVTCNDAYSNTALSGLTVVLDGATTSAVTGTESSGTWPFDIGVTDNYTVAVSDSSFPAAGAWGGATKEYQTTSTPAFNINLTTSANPTALSVKVITGRVSIAYGSSGANKAVALYYKKTSNNTWVTVTTISSPKTDGSGNITWDGLPPGTYCAAITLSGSSTKYTNKFDVAAGVSTPYSFSSSTMPNTTKPTLP